MVLMTLVIARRKSVRHECIIEFYEAMQDKVHPLHEKQKAWYGRTYHPYRVKVGKITANNSVWWQVTLTCGPAHTS